MIRDLKRKKQSVSSEQCEEILKKGNEGVLALLGDDDYPYTVPMNYVYTDGKIYFHCAKEGHKIDSVKKCDKASFCVISKNDIVPAEYTTYYESVIAFGRIHIIEDEDLKRKAINALCIRYVPKSSDTERKLMIDKYWNALCMMELSIEKLTGKIASELTK